MPNGHHNNIKTGDRPQSSTTIDRRSQHSSRYANETSKTPTTTMEQIPRRSVNSPYGQHTELLGAEPTATLGGTGHGNSIAPTPLATDPPVTQKITEHLVGIKTPQQTLLTARGIQHIEDLAAPETGIGHQLRTQMRTYNSHNTS